jgi:hypothetical protein
MAKRSDPDADAALCIRLVPQLVSAADCDRCAYRQPSPEPTVYWRRADECPHCGGHEIAIVFRDPLIRVLECEGCGRWWTSSVPK